MKSAFTMMELIFVIVILGALAVVAVPKLNSTQNHALIGKGRSDVASIRSAILTERQSQIIKGVNTWISKLTPASSTKLFTGDGAGRTLLKYGIKQASSGNGWKLTAANTYTYTVDTTSTTFTYSSSDGTFTCTAASDNYCEKLTE